MGIPLTPILMGSAALAGLGFGYAFKDDIKQHAGYAGYILPHKYHVYNAAREMGVPFTRAISHDMSKLRPDEWMAYSGWFNGPQGQYGTRDPQQFRKWRAGTVKHYERNDHHFRARHVHPDNVPLDVKLEAIADWYGVNRTKGFTNKSFKDWFEARKHTFPIDKATVEEAERRIFGKDTPKVYVSPQLTTPPIQKTAGRYFLTSKLPKGVTTLFKGQVNPTRRHLTVKFLGELNEQQVTTIKALMDDIAKTQIAPKAVHMGYVNNPPNPGGRYHATFAAPGIENIRTRIDEALPEISGIPLKTHMTLNYREEGNLQAPIFGNVGRLRKLILINSDKGEYIDVHKVLLKKAALSFGTTRKFVEIGKTIAPTFRKTPNFIEAAVASTLRSGSSAVYKDKGEIRAFILPKPATSETIAHEVGHAIAFNAGVRPEYPLKQEMVANTAAMLRIPENERGIFLADIRKAIGTHIHGQGVSSVISQDARDKLREYYTKQHLKADDTTILNKAYRVMRKSQEKLSPGNAEFLRADLRNIGYNPTYFARSPFAAEFEKLRP